MKNAFLSALLGSVLLFSGCKSSKPVAENDCLGPKKEGCICTKEYNPVCGCDGKTYGNACEAGCAGVKKFEPGACK